MKSIYLLPLLLVLASSKLSGTIYNNQKPFPRTFFSCLAASNVTLTILQIWDEIGMINKNFLLNYIRSKDAKIQDFDALVTVKDSFTPEDLCEGVSHALPPSFNGTVWLDIQSRQGLWSRDVSERIPYLDNMAKACHNRGLKPGISSNWQRWTAVMGSQGAGSDTLKAIPLWYDNNNFTPNFDDFEYAGFGTWETPKMKNYGGSNLCDRSTGVGLSYFEA